MDLISQFDGLSIIVPNYNGERFLKRFFEAFLNQSNGNYEIVFVDDGSNDFSVNIAKQFSTKLKLKLILNNHEGVGNARKSGIENASGKFITFVDTDDLVSSDFVEVNLSAMEGISELVFFPVNVSHGDAVWKTKLPFGTKTQSEVRELLIENKIAGWLFQTVSYRKIWESNDFAVGLGYGEDIFALVNMLRRVTTPVNFLDIQPVYTYKENPNSITRSSTSESFSLMRDAAITIIEKNKNNDVYQLDELSIARSILVFGFANSLSQGNQRWVSLFKKTIFENYHLLNIPLSSGIRVCLNIYAVRKQINRNIEKTRQLIRKIYNVFD
ncbi:glycosyltransferase family 2 protein [Weissella soli]|uniref:glycosyltransferase family 2 protein n=1 Tax=Weissella soli TaxID=155866 RepID=UPI001F2F5286|nr:glycosyltransferase family 2 protein [Weissella soli]GJM47740.1 hypothetical protein WSSLDB02_02970 [Weissella soli]